MKLAERLGIMPSASLLSIEDMPPNLRNRLWNLTYMFLKVQAEENSLNNFRESKLQWLKPKIWHLFFKQPIDKIPYTDPEVISHIREFFYKAKWNNIYDFIEFILEYSEDCRIPMEEILNSYNITLEEEVAAFRLLDKKFVPITNDDEIESIKVAIKSPEGEDPFTGARIHFKNAIQLLSDKNNPKYANSIKESISALENVCRIVTGEKSLGKALQKINKTHNHINSQLIDGFEKIYAYTNNKENGIRHALIEDINEPDFHDAKYMLVACSAFVHFLTGKLSLNQE